MVQLCLISEEIIMSRPLKKSGFSQGLFVTSSTKREEIGTLRITQDGRMFRYARNGAVALTQGLATTAIAPVANIIGEAAPATVKGSRSFLFTAGGAVTYAEDYFAGGYVTISGGPDEGTMYEIESSSAVTAGTSIYISLRESTRLAWTTSTLLTLHQSPSMAVIVSATETDVAAGIPQIEVPISHYFWNQTHGPAMAILKGTEAVGVWLILADTNGYLMAATTTAAVTTNLVIAETMDTGTTADFQCVKLFID